MPGTALLRNSDDNRDDSATGDYFASGLDDARARRGGALAVAAA